MIMFQRELLHGFWLHLVVVLVESGNILDQHLQKSETKHLHF